MKSFFSNLQNSIYSPSFYSSIPKKSFKKSISYFLLLALLLTAIHLITLIGPLFFEAPLQLQLLAQNTIDCFPKDLEVKISNGQVTSNTKEPYFLSACGTPAGSQNLVVIDTKTPFSSAKFDEYKAGLWLTKDSVVYKKNNVETRSYSLIQIKDFKLNKDSLNSFSNMLSPWYKFVGPVLILLSALGFYLFYTLRLIYLLILAVIILVAGKFFKQNLSYWQSYKVSLYAITLGLLVELVVSLTSRSTNFYGFPFMVTIITLGVVLANLFLPKNVE